MIYLLLGKDDYTKKEFMTELKTREQVAALEYFYEWNEPAVLSAVKNSGLFEKKKMVAVFGALGKFDLEEFADKLKDSANTLIFIEESLDKRKTETKKILANKNLKVQEFEIPAGADFKKWVQNYAKKIELKINPKALDAFLQKMGIESAEGERLYNLWQTSFELNKLKTFAESKEITAAEIEELVTENVEENIFKITNAIGDKNRQAAAKYLVEFMDRIPGSDEKSKVISLSGILAEQFRGILTVQGLLAEQLPEVQIMKQTGFSPGRLFVYKKLARNFNGPKLLDTLKKLELLDAEVKTSSGPAALQFLMIINSAIS